VSSHQTERATVLADISPRLARPVSRSNESRFRLSDTRVRFAGGPADGEDTELPVLLEIVEVVEDRRGRVFEIRTGIPVDNLRKRVLYRRSIVDPSIYVFQP
jgi:hypothetical protein